MEEVAEDDDLFDVVGVAVFSDGFECPDDVFLAVADA